MDVVTSTTYAMAGVASAVTVSPTIAAMKFLMPLRWRRDRPALQAGAFVTIVNRADRGAAMPSRRPSTRRGGLARAEHSRARGRPYRAQACPCRAARHRAAVSGRWAGG